MGTEDEGEKTYPTATEGHLCSNDRLGVRGC